MRGLFILVLKEIQRSSRQGKLALPFLISVLAILILPGAIRSHEPITTKVRFNKEVIRIFERHCLACHNSASDIPLDTYARARPWAKAFKEEILEKRMPPYQAVKGFGSFREDYALTQLEIDQIVSWVEGGVPKGEDKDLPATSTTSHSWTLGQPDLILKPKGEAPVTAGDEYRCFVLPTNLKRNRWLSAVDFHPGNDAAMHCATFEIELAGGKGQNCETNKGTADDSLGRWVPGQTVARLPGDVARLLPAGSRILLRIHYRKSAEAASTQSSLGLYFAREHAQHAGHAPTLLHSVALAPAKEEELPAGADRYRVKVDYIIADSADAIAIRPLFFPFAMSVEVTAHRPDGTSEVLIWARDYRYDWEPEYEFKRPVSLPAGTRIEAVAYLDNSDKNPNNPNHPAQAVRFNSALCELSFVKR